MAEQNFDMNELKASLGKIFENAEVEQVTSEGSGFENLKDGYYLSAIEKVELKPSKKGQPMFQFTFSVIQDGLATNISETGDIELVPVKSSKGRKIFKFYPFSPEDARSTKQFTSDMLKFSDDDGNPVLIDAETVKAYFMNPDTIDEALEAVTGLFIYIHLETRENKNEPGTTSQWGSLVSWKRAAQLELPDYEG